MKSNKEILFEVFKDLRSLIIIFVFAGLLTVVSSICFDHVPILIHVGIYKEDSFWAGFLGNLHNSLLDILIFTVVLSFFTKKRDFQREIQNYKEIVEEFRELKTETASRKITYCIRKFSKYKIENANLTRCYLCKAKLWPDDDGPIKLVRARLNGVNFSDANMKKMILRDSDLQAALLYNANLQSVNLQGAGLKNIKCDKTDFKGANLQNTNFSGAILENSTFKNADFRGANLSNVSFKGSEFQDANFKNVVNLDVARLIECKSLKKAKFDDNIKSEIDSIRPDLLRN
ncbi:hypothetical protein COL75_13425 [Bacillus wiedmannii]|uniref:pentapeptide repeat-containing protein n=1 Tax=Bacillus wiedmannii TaxID=1890302 RepID=UPI000BF87ED0|nr:pentapeptide repeat-containing protein [Bacillus wiedmannii]PFZ03188.1 hypothetical protein COL75_13425 [Bacillus wiedmannii]